MHVGPQPVLEQAHVLDEAVLVDEVALQHRPVVEGDEAGAAADDREHGPETPGRALGVAHHLDVVAGLVHEAAGEAVEGRERPHLLREGGDDRRRARGRR